jgi:alpha-L-fucosidase
MSNPPEASFEGDQRLPLARLRQWEELGFGMFIHFGMSTFAGEEIPDGTQPLSLYSPDRLDVDQWVSVARDTGMNYAVLTAKHVSGHCLWPTRWTDYHVGNSPVKTDVVEAFVNACNRRGVLPALYYCCWDNHNRFGSTTPSDVFRLPADQQAQGPHAWAFQSVTTRAYQDFVANQVEELMTRYGRLAELWVDIPGVLPPGFRKDLYGQVAAWQPDMPVMMNSGAYRGPQYEVSYSWPSDLVSMEHNNPPSPGGYDRWHAIDGKRYYMPGEACNTLTKNWFFVENDPPRDDLEVLGTYLVSRTRGANFVLDVPPDRSGRIGDDCVGALARLRANLDRLGATRSAP